MKLWIIGLIVLSGCSLLAPRPDYHRFAQAQLAQEEIDQQLDQCGRDPECDTSDRYLYLWRAHLYAETQVQHADPSNYTSDGSDWAYISAASAH